MNEGTELSTEHPQADRPLRSPPPSKALRELAQLGLTLAIVVGLPYGAWKLHKQQNDRDARAWLSRCGGIADPWERFKKLKLETRPSLTDDQGMEAARQSDAALTTALEQGSSDAFDFAERWPGSYAALLDKYPRDRLIRQEQLRALWIVWPGVESMPTDDRLALINMASRCHLHEAEAPIESDTVLSCVRYGAQSLHAERTLTRLLDSARLFRPLTAAP